MQLGSRRGNYSDCTQAALTLTRRIIGKLRPNLLQNLVLLLLPREVLRLCSRRRQDLLLLHLLLAGALGSVITIFTAYLAAAPSAKTASTSGTVSIVPRLAVESVPFITHGCTES